MFKGFHILSRGTRRTMGNALTWSHTTCGRSPRYHSSMAGCSMIASLLQTLRKSHIFTVTLNPSGSAVTKPIPCASRPSNAVAQASSPLPLLHESSITGRSRPPLAATPWSACPSRGSLKQKGWKQRLRFCCIRKDTHQASKECVPRKTRK